MKKTLLFFALAFLLAPLSRIKADEGMWTLVNLPQAVYDKMVEEGYQLDYDQLYMADNAIYNAVVNFGGFCSGVVVSPDGLVFTNHHCGFEAIRSHSTVEHDYMLNGFYAKTYDEELPNEGLYVAFLIGQRDVTDLVEEYSFRNQDSDTREEMLNAIEEMENRRVKAIDPTFSAELKPYYERNRYYVDVYQQFNDVRLVFAIPKSMGKFGGETDNWMWPRQTCDFSVFRIYADPDTNGPADYSPENVPFHPETWAQVSLEGYKDGDFAMTMGYPGSTNRYLSSFGIYEMRNAENEPRWQTREVKQKVMLSHMRADEGVRIKYDSKYAQSSNYWKNAIGMNHCIDSLDIIGLKQQHEAAIQKYVNETGYLADKLDLQKLDSLYKERFEAVRHLTLFTETFRADELTSRAMSYARGAQLQGPEGKPQKQYYVTLPDNSEAYDLDTDREMLAVLLKNYRQQALEEYLPDFYKTIDTDFGGDCARYAEALYRSQLMGSQQKLFVNKKNFKDLGVDYGRDLYITLLVLYMDYLATEEEISEQERYLCAAKLRMEEDMPHYSDANFTLRLSYGQVGGYMLGSNLTSYYTTPESLYRKMQLGDEAKAGKDYNFEYFAEPVMHELFSAKDFGQYTDPVTGTMNLCFLTSNDITGGNSGSPVFDGRNRLIGLAFDGNWESLSADIFFDKKLARCICVDIRYVLYMMDKWGHADRLLKEIDAK